MDTRYWGPSGWRLLHMISFARPRNPEAVCAFFHTLPFVLPCKFCRQSLSEYYMADPPDCAVREGRLGRWFWRIHNAVNAKLRKQGLPSEADPTFQKVRKVYEDRLAAGCTRTTFEGWEFLFSVAECHPLSRGERVSAPIAGHPPLEELTTASPLERNRWNVMRPEERLPYYQAFWELLPAVLPFPEWEAAWRRTARGSSPTQTTCRSDCLKGVWAIRRGLEKELELLNQTTFDSLCKELRDVRSGCGVAGARRKTCRRKRGAH
jgi:hypothetical protein